MVCESDLAPTVRTVAKWAGYTVEPAGHSCETLPAAATTTAPSRSARWSAPSMPRVSTRGARAGSTHDTTEMLIIPAFSSRALWIDRVRVSKSPAPGVSPPPCGMEDDER